jgi:hypothetical protein
VVLLLASFTITGKEKNSTVSSAAFEAISGPLPKMLKAKDKPYLVISDIEVPLNRTVTIEPGVVILFKNFTGLHVQGKLLAEGTKGKPIIFTSEFDKTYNPSSTLLPNPYDWNGIYIHDDAFGTIMANSTVAYTVYGIISDTKFIRLDDITFLYNGKTNLKIEDREHTVGLKPYNYNLSINDATVDGIQVNLLKDPMAPKRNTLRYTGLGLIIGGIGLGIYSAIKLSDSWAEWDNINDPIYVQGHPELLVNNSSYYNEVESNKNRDVALTSLGLGIGILGIAGFTWSFTF